MNLKITTSLCTVGACLLLLSCGGAKGKAADDGSADNGTEQATGTETTTTSNETMNSETSPTKINYTVGDTQTLPSGLKIVFKEIKNGDKPASGDAVKVHYKGALASGNEFDNSFKRGEPIGFTLGSGMVIKGWDEGISYLGKGDKATLIIPPSLGYGDRNMGNGLIPPNSTLVFDVELVDFSEGYKPFDKTGKEEVVTASGLKFYIIEKGDLSKKPKPGQTAVAHYAGFLTNGKKFDASYDRGQPFEFPVGQGRVIKGWDEVIQLMGVGSKYKVVIPPSLGYGMQGAPPSIPGNATLVFDMELLGIK